MAATVNSFADSGAMKKILPLPAGASGEFQPPPCADVRRHILVVEDDPLLRRLSSQLLSRSGYEVDGAEDGAASWEALQAAPYDLLIGECHVRRGRARPVGAGPVVLPAVVASRATAGK